MPNCVSSISGIIILLCYISIPHRVWCQDTTTKNLVTSADQLSEKFISSIGKKYSNLENKLMHSTEKTLKRLQNKEDKINKKLIAKDSVSAQKIFSAQQQYSLMFQRLKDPNQTIEKSLKGYVPNVYRRGTIFGFLDKDGIKMAAIEPDKLKAIQSAAASLKGLQVRLQTSSDIQSFIRQRKQLLQSQLEQFGLTKQFRVTQKLLDFDFEG